MSLIQQACRCVHPKSSTISGVEEKDLEGVSDSGLVTTFIYFTETLSAMHLISLCYGDLSWYLHIL